MRLIDIDEIPWAVDGVGDIPVITKEEIEAMPTVRCRECRDWRTDQICKTGDDWACADFKRKKNETD